MASPQRELFERMRERNDQGGSRRFNGLGLTLAGTLLDVLTQAGELLFENRIHGVPLTQVGLRPLTAVAPSRFTLPTILAVTLRNKGLELRRRHRIDSQLKIGNCH